jgi:hypothetical protein
VRGNATCAWPSPRSLVIALFAAAAVHGYRLEKGRRDSRNAHALLGGLAALGAIVAAVAGFVLLP